MTDPDNWIAGAEDKLLAASLKMDSETEPEDFVSCTGSRARSSTSKCSKLTNRARSRGSHVSSGPAARVKEDPKVAELKAEGRMLRMRQTLEEKKFRLKQQETRLNLEAEISKTVAKKEALATMAASVSRSDQLRVKLEAWFNSEDNGTLYYTGT